MKKTLFFASILTLLSSSLCAQVTGAETKKELVATEKTLRTQSTDTTFGWTFSGLASLNAANTWLVNWIAGGENSLGFESNAMAFANLRKPKFVWENSASAALGTMRQGDDTNPFLKTNDKLAFNSKYGQRAYKDFFYSALVNFETQMLEGKKYTPDTTITVSRFLAPGYLLAAIGMDYNPNSNLSLFVSPLSARFTIVKDQQLADAGAFGVTPGNHYLNQYGGYVRFVFKKSAWNWEIMKNVMFVTKLNLFSNYADKPQNVKVDWENQLLFKVNKYITFMFSNQYVYDDDIKIIDRDGDKKPDVSAGQYKQITSLGIAYKF